MSKCEIIADVVVPDHLVLYDHELLTDLKHLTVEELYVRLLNELSVLDPEKISKDTGLRTAEDRIRLNEKQHQDREKQLTHRDEIIVYLAELYRRLGIGGHWAYDNNWLYYDKVLCKGKKICYETMRYAPCKFMEPNTIRTSKYQCFACDPHGVRLSEAESRILHEQTISEQYFKGFCKQKFTIENQLNVLRRVKELQISLLKKPKIYDEIETLLDTLLDDHKISFLKEYVNPEHYRMIRAGVDVREIKDPEILLASLRNVPML